MNKLFSLLHRGLYWSATSAICTVSICSAVNHMPIAQTAPTQSEVCIAFYNVENLFDTVPDPDIDDNAFTPAGSYHWDSERYTQKLVHIARVLDHLKADLVGLCEVENESVVRDLVTTLQTDYNYIHRDSPDNRGIDQALLYRGSIFTPAEICQSGGWGNTRPLLVVSGELLGEEVSIIICHQPSVMNRTARRKAAANALRQEADKILSRDPEAKIIVMGDFNSSPNSALARKNMGIYPLPAASPCTPAPINRHHRASPNSAPQSDPQAEAILYTPFTESEQQGYATYIYRDQRYIYDYIALSSSLVLETHPCRRTIPAGLDMSESAAAPNLSEVSTPPVRLHFAGRYGIWSAHYLFQEEGPRSGYPHRTFEQNRYLGGYSDHLPIYLILRRSAQRDEELLWR